jgi:hypothetical protein
MATHQIPILGGERPDAGVPLDLVANQITEATSPSVGDVLAYVFADGGADEGVWGRFTVPKNYVGTPVLVVKAILDGTPAAAAVLGIGMRKRAVANNEAADGTFDAEQTGSSTIGSNGSGHADEDEVEQTITLTGGDYAVDDTVYFYAFIDASVNDYTGNVLVTSIEFRYADA